MGQQAWLWYGMYGIVDDGLCSKAMRVSFVLKSNHRLCGDRKQAEMRKVRKDFPVG